MANVVYTKFQPFVFLFVSLLQSSFTQNCPMNLSNTVVYEGNRTSFVIANNTQAVQWQVIPSSTFTDPIDITNYDDTVATQFNSTYTVNKTALTILTATASSPTDGSMPYSTAGLYFLNYQNPDCTTAAGLIVIRSGPVCTCDTSIPNKVQLHCTVVFGSFSRQYIVPNMTWTTSNGVVVDTEKPQPMGLDTSNDGLQQSDSVFTVPSGSQEPNYTCQVKFTAPDPSQPPIATNAPDFTASCLASYPVPTTSTSTAPTASNVAMATTFTSTVPTAPPNVTMATTSTGNVPTDSNVTIATTSTSTASAASGVTIATTSASSASNASTTTTSTTSASSASTNTTISTSPSNVTSASSLPSVQSASYTTPTSSVSKQPTVTTTSASQPESKALAILLSLVLGSVFLATCVTVCWCYCSYCCCPVGAPGKKRTRRKPTYPPSMLYQKRDPATSET